MFCGRNAETRSVIDQDISIYFLGQYLINVQHGKANWSTKIASDWVRVGFSVAEYCIICIVVLP